MKDHCRKILLYLVLSALYAATPLWADDFSIAVYAKMDIPSARDRWQPTLDYLSATMPQHRFTLHPVRSLLEMNEMAIDGQFDFVITNPSSYVEMGRLGGAKALVTLVNKRANTAQDHLGTVIFVHALNQEVLHLGNVRGKTVMAVSEQAFGGWRIAWHELLRSGVDPARDLRELLFAPGGVQHEVVRAVLDRKVDVGVVCTGQLERMQQAGKIDLRYVRILNSRDSEGFPLFHSSELYPEWPFAAFEFVPRDVVQQVTRALLTITPDMPAAMRGHYVGWRQPADYGAVTRMMQTLGILPMPKSAQVQ